MKKKIIGDCHDLIKDVAKNSIDLIYFDPPFGITKKEWDKPLDYHKLFPEFWRVLKSNGAIIIHCSIPFTYQLIRDHSKHLKYHYTWNRGMVSNFLNANKQPIRFLEEILVFYKKQCTYNTSVFENPDYHCVDNKNTHTTEYYGTHTKKKTVGKKDAQRDLLEFKRTDSDFTRPKELIDHIIKLYSNEGEKILDITCGTGRVGDRCESLKRDCIGFEIRENL